MPAEQSVDQGVRARDARILALIGSGHFFSHFYGIVLPPLFPLMQADLGVSYAALGLLLTLANTAGTACQVPAGFLVDRFGTRRLLVLGLALMSAAIAVAGLVPSYAMLVPAMVLVGIGNSVFHPADYAILSARIAPSRLGRAFSLHTFAGNLGWAVAPATMIFLTGLWSWRTALVIAGLCGLAVALVMLARGRVLELDPPRPVRGARRAGPDAGTGAGAASPGLRALLTAPLLLFFLYMMLSSLAAGGLHGFTVAALVTERAASLPAANTALTALLIAGALGVLLGGQLADRTLRHDLIVAGGLVAAAAILSALAVVPLPLAAVVAGMALVGLAQGSVRPARDMMVRAVAPSGAVGTVFGFVTTGMNVGGALAPVIFGWLIDRGSAQLVFVLAAIAMLLGLAAALLANRQARRSRPVPAR